VIKGWELGVPKLSLGEKAKLIIPYKLGYGEKGYSPNIPPKADLIFEVELLAINDILASNKMKNPIDSRSSSKVQIETIIKGDERTFPKKGDLLTMHCMNFRLYLISFHPKLLICRYMVV